MAEGSSTGGRHPHVGVLMYVAARSLEELACDALVRAGAADVTPALIDEASRLYHEQPLEIDRATISDALSPERFIAKRTLQGGPAREESLRQADVFATALTQDDQSVASIDARLADAARKLEAAIDGIIADAEGR